LLARFTLKRFASLSKLVSIALFQNDTARTANRLTREVSGVTAAAKLAAEDSVVHEVQLIFGEFRFHS